MKRVWTWWSRWSKRVSTVSCAAWAGVAPLPSSAAEAPALADTSCPRLLQHQFPRLQDEKEQSLCQYAGQVILVVNTASQCGFTGQYKGLETLYDRYRSRGFVVLGFPSNDFRQESGSNTEIASFCENTFGVRFPMFAKTQVSGDGAAPFFRQLTQQAGHPPRWNFYKFLLGRDGRLINSYSSLVSPDNKGLVRDIEEALQAPVPAQR